MTERRSSGHDQSGAMDSTAAKFPRDAAAPPPTPATPATVPSFDELYAQHFAFVWRNLRRLGVPQVQVEDAAQDTFVVVHRKLGDLRPEASAKGWLFAIAAHVARDYRRKQRRKPTMSLDADIVTSAERSPFENVAAAQASDALERFLGTLDDDRRAVFVLAELEEMSAPEMSEALGVGVNTLYSRLRNARQRFVAFLADEGCPHG
jgi:RNA polymerase sigma-70 factor (ECF subfamily)